VWLAVSILIAITWWAIAIPGIISLCEFESTIELQLMVSFVESDFFVFISSVN
jgi:hypothetical protein